MNEPTRAYAILCAAAYAVRVELRRNDISAGVAAARWSATWAAFEAAVKARRAEVTK